MKLTLRFAKQCAEISLQREVNPVRLLTSFLVYVVELGANRRGPPVLLTRVCFDRSRVKPVATRASPIMSGAASLAR